MGGREFEGKNIDHAIERACQAFVLSRDKLQIEIVSPGSTGFLGILGVKKAVVRASLLSLYLLEKEETPRTGPREGRQPAPSQKTSPAEKPLPVVTPPKSPGTADQARELLTGIIRRMDLKCLVKARENHEAIFLTITGKDGAFLSGKNGQTLDALQYLLNKAVIRSENGKKAILVDFDGRLKQQGESLSALARNLGEEVKKTRKPVTLNPMDAHSRRIIHMTLRDDKSLTTISKGEGKNRKIVILPAKNQ